MKCHHVQSLLPLYAGRDLGRFQGAAIRRHLAACASCRHNLEELQAAQRLTVEAVRRQAVEVSTTDLWQEVLYALPRREVSAETAPREKKGPLQRFVPVLIGAGALIIALLFNEGPQLVMPAEDQTAAALPIVESVDEPGVTVMTFTTEDPQVTIVWLFREGMNL